MSAPRPALRALARHLLEDEAARPAMTARGAEVVFGRLRERLVDVIGVRGFEALLGRALRLARADAPLLERLHPTLGGGLGDLDRLAEPGVEGAAAADVAALECLLAHLLELLATFVGADLTARLAQGIRRGGGEPERAAEEP